MDRYRIPHRPNKKRTFNNARTDVCRQFLNGTCRYGQNCHYPHHLPSTPLCWYFQEGNCWFGDRCRFVHATVPGTTDRRRGSAPAVIHPPREHTSNSRRGSEPTVASSQRRSGQGRQSQIPRSRSTSLERAFNNLARIAEDGGSAATPSHKVQADSGCSPDSGHASSTSSPLQGQSTSGATSHTQEPSETSQPQGAVAIAASSASASVQSSDESSSAYEQSVNVVCGICMDRVYEKVTPQSRRFGILPNCSHAFCIDCIVTWRRTKSFQEEVIKACPQCRVRSPFYIPCKYWVESGKPKEDLIASFKQRSSKIKCRFFSKDGYCPFQSECIYFHEGPARPPRRSSRMPIDDLEGFQPLDHFIALSLLSSIADFDDDEDFDDDDDFGFHHSYFYDSHFLASLFGPDFIDSDSD